QRQPFTDDESENALARRTERHANADLGRALSDCGRQDAVEPDRSENRRHRAEDRDQHERKARGCHRAINVVAHRLEIAYRDARVDLRDDTAYFRNETYGIPIRAHRKSARGPEAEHCVWREQGLATGGGERQMSFVRGNANDVVLLRLSRVDSRKELF